MKTRKKQQNVTPFVSIYFGLPGSGKTTMSSYLAHRSQLRNEPVWCNMPMSGCFVVKKEDLGRFNISHGRLILDEASTEFFSRRFKSFTDKQNQFFRLHRHYRLSIDLFSQGWDDCDKVLRTIAHRYFLVSKSRIPYCTRVDRIYKSIDIDKETHQPCDVYRFMPGILRFFCFGRWIIFNPPLWKHFDSYECPPLEKKPFPVWFNEGPLDLGTLNCKHGLDGHTRSDKTSTTSDTSEVN